MCGFVGYLNRSGAPIDSLVLEQMRAAQRHRGPDDSGLATFSLRKGVCWPLTSGSEPLDGGFGFNRLSVQDLTAAGHQPMINDDGSLLLVYNGEIYNAADFRAELEARGHRFRGHSDTEVLLKLYETFGIDEALRRVNGMFAFAIADLRRQQLVLARDRLGIKPLYYFEQGDVFGFASEVKSFLSHPNFAAELEPEAMSEYLQFRYIAGEQTLLRNVLQVAPGTHLIWNLRGQTISRYWSLPSTSTESAHSLESVVEEVERRLRLSVKSQLLSDVPVGCQLSGGIDSSLVTVMANAVSGARFEGFSIVVDDAGCSEEPWIDAVAHKTGVRVNKFTMTSDTFSDRLKSATWHLDQPINHPNSIGIKFLAERARPSVTVMLSGEGADEVFGGYHRFFRGQFFPLVKTAGAFLSPVPYFRRRLANFRDDQASWFIKLSAFVSDAHARAVSPLANPTVALARRRARFPSGPFMRSALNYEMETYLTDLLIRQDKMTMAHSVENRVPFLDHSLVEYVATLPTSTLVGYRPHLRDTEMRNLKRVLKSVACRSFPDSFVFRPKMGFAVPLQRFLTSPPLRQLVHEEILPSVRMRGLFNPRVLESWYEDLSGRGNAEAFWVCFAFELWARQFLDFGRS